MNIDLAKIYPIVFPNRQDPLSGLQLCRWCGKPITNKNIRKGPIFYCDADCRLWTYKALSWSEARKATYQRDGGKCRICGRKVQLNDSDRGENEVLAEIHHVERPSALNYLAHMVTKEIEDKERRIHWLCKLYALMYLDINNLMTLCKTPCHDQVHAADYRNQLRVKERTVRKLEEFNTGRKGLRVEAGSASA